MARAGVARSWRGKEKDFLVPALGWARCGVRRSAEPVLEEPVGAGLELRHGGEEAA